MAEIGEGPDGVDEARKRAKGGDLADLNARITGAGEAGAEKTATAAADYEPGIPGLSVKERLAKALKAIVDKYKAH